VVPREAEAAIRDKALFDSARIDEIEREVKHDVIAFVSNVAENVGPHGRWLHYGLTSSDVVDTALALTMVKAADQLIAGVDRLLTVLERQAKAHKRTVMVGRTHGIHAEPYTLGLKFVSWYHEARRNRERLAAAREEVRTGKLSGAVGTYAHLDPTVEPEVLAVLGLAPEPLATQVIPRDRHATYVAALGVLASSLDRIATEIRHLQRTDVREVEEPFAPGQKGSSAMPHKRNPITAERICGLARVVRAHALVGLENVALWHERDISHSSAERVVLPDSFLAIDYMLERFAWLVEGLVVRPERMLVNIHAGNGLFFSQRLLSALVESGVSRDVAYRQVQRHAMRAWEEGLDLRELTRADADLAARVDLDSVFTLDAYTAHVQTVFDRLRGLVATRSAPVHA